MIIYVDNKIIHNQNVAVISLTNNCGLKATFMSLGASIFSCSLQKSNGEEVDVLVSPKDPEDFFNESYYFGKTIGRVAGRIDKGLLKFEGRTIELEKNWRGISCLHGSSKGIHIQNFEYEFLPQNKYWDITFKTKVLQDNDNIPGNINLGVVYRVYDKENRIDVIYNYIANRNTICSFTNHACFNLNNCKGTILKHKLTINSTKYGELNNELITTKTQRCTGPMNFGKARVIGNDIECDYLQNHIAKGYDHPFVLNSKNSDDMAAILENDDGSVTLTVTTSYPSLVIYTDNYPDDFILRNGEKNEKYKGICIEPSFFPNSCNNKDLGEQYIEKNKLYSQSIEWIFDVK